jgi:hypothetical protein
MIPSQLALPFFYLTRLTGSSYKIKTATACTMDNNRWRQIAAVLAVKLAERGVNHQMQDAQ